VDDPADPRLRDHGLSLHGRAVPRTLVETGIVGFLAFVWMISSVLRLTVSR